MVRSRAEPVIFLCILYNLFPSVSLKRIIESIKLHCKFSMKLPDPRGIHI